MVSCPSGISLRRGVAPSPGAGFAYIGAPGATPIVSDECIAPDRMEIVRRQLRDRGFSSAVVSLLMASSQPGTLAAYDSAWRNWTIWCVGRGTDPLSATLADILQYCTDLHASGKSDITVNLHRSALSKTVGQLEGFAIGEHPLVIRLLKGCYHLNPPCPKNGSIWDTNQVFSYIASLGENKHLGLSALVGKLVTLLALATLMRVSELAAIDCYIVRRWRWSEIRAEKVK